MQVFVFDSEACNPDEMRTSFLPPSRTAALSRTNAGSGESRPNESTSQAADAEDSKAMQKSGKQLLAEAKVNEPHQDPEVCC